MSSTYLIYTEAKIDGVWRCIDGYIPFKGWNDKEERLTLMTTYESGSRSYFGETYNELRSIGTSELFSELSEEVQSEHPGLMYEENFFSRNKDDEDKTEASYTVVAQRDFEAHVPSNYEYHGVYHKDHISAFESGEVDYLYRDDDLDLKSLTEKEQKCYQYYEWDDRMGWFYNSKKIKQAFDSTVEKYCRNTFQEPADIRLVVFCL